MRLRALCLVAGLEVAAPAPGATAPPEPEMAAARDALARHTKDPFEQQVREAALRDLGRIGGEEAARAVAGVLDDPFVHLRDHAISALVAMLRGPRADDAAAWLVRGGLGARTHPSLRRAAAIALGVARRPHAAGPVAAAALREGDPVVAAAMCEACERLGDASAVDTLLPLLAAKVGGLAGSAARAVGRAGSRGPPVLGALRACLGHEHALARAGAVDGLAAADPAGLLALAAGLLDDAAVEPRIALADALGGLAQGRGRGRVLDLLARLLADPSWRVRVAACEAAAAIWDRGAIPLLVDRLRIEVGRPRGDVLRALCTLSGQDVGTDPDLWAAWWRVHGGGLDLGARPAPDRFGRVRRPTTTPETGVPGETRTAAFFALPLASTRLAFLFDFSGSMRDPFDGGGGDSKAELALREFGAAARGLGKDVAYDLFIYRYPSAFPPAPAMSRALGALAPGGETTARRAVAWLSKEKAQGWGALYDGLVACAEEEVDTIVLLSDGVPSRGTYVRDDRFIDEFVRHDRFRRVAVDTVLVGTKGADRRFMESLADATGGRFQDATKGRTARR